MQFEFVSVLGIMKVVSKFGVSNEKVGYRDEEKT